MQISSNRDLAPRIPSLRTSDLVSVAKLRIYLKMSASGICWEQEKVSTLPCYCGYTRPRDLPAQMLALVPKVRDAWGDIKMSGSPIIRSRPRLP